MAPEPKQAGRSWPWSSSPGAPATPRITRKHAAVPTKAHPEPSRQLPGSTDAATPNSAKPTSGIRAIQPWPHFCAGHLWQGYLGSTYGSGPRDSLEVWRADAKEVGSFDRCSRRVRLWAKRAAGWMTDGDAALLLVESLSGAAERELEFTPLAEIGWSRVRPAATRGELKRAPGLSQTPLPSCMGNRPKESW